MSNTVAQRSDAVAKMVDAAAKSRALMAGSKGMRAAGKAYLPKFEAEQDADYKARLTASWLFNGYRKTIRDMTGKVFAKPVEIDGSAPPVLMEWAENIDMQGNDLSVFMRNVFEDGYEAGISFIWVDAPPREGEVTRQRTANENLRPYFVHLQVEDVLGWKCEPINNVMTLTQFRIMETVKEQDPKDEFKQETIDQVRVLDLIEGRVQVRLFRKEGGKATDTWALYEEPTFTDMDQITVVPFYANRTAYFCGEPLLDDLADVNIAHWQSQSDQRHILHFARVPILFAAGRGEHEGKMVIAPGVATTSENPDAKLAWVEHSGAAIDAGRQDLKDLEFQMETYGLQLLAAKPGGQSATGEALDAAKETSTLGMTADQLQDAGEQAIAWLLEYGGLTGEVSLSVNKDYGVSMMDAQELTAMLTAVNTGNMSRETFLREMVRRGMIASNTVVEDEMERIEDEGLMTAEDLADGDE